MKLPAIFLLLVATLRGDATAPERAFPGAEGFGSIASGGRGGDVYYVTNRNASGTGSFAYGIQNAPAAGRTIEIDMHAKGLNQVMIDMAAKTGMPVKARP